MIRLVHADRKSTVTQIITLYNRGEQKSISAHSTSNLESRPLNLRHEQLNQSEAESSPALSAGSVSARASAVRQQVGGGASASLTEATFSFYITPQQLLRTGPEPSGSSLLPQVSHFSSYQLRFHVCAMHQVR
ncbi:hypothetical protein PGIGA_G00123050 [Pangasianodon gigas]|uniref:Uncharacterized protein n=1 Tax=Pangasianodon gigas TaxID=30993 RepID=A0ACC5XGU1_PANGG|nr:hypothetical protein [Pangasianodon gigas]